MFECPSFPKFKLQELIKNINVITLNFNFYNSSMKDLHLLHIQTLGRGSYEF